MLKFDHLHEHWYKRLTCLKLPAWIKLNKRSPIPPPAPKPILHGPNKCVRVCSELICFCRQWQRRFGVSLLTFITLNETTLRHTSVIMEPRCFLLIFAKYIFFLDIMTYVFGDILCIYWFFLKYNASFCKAIYWFIAFWKKFLDVILKIIEL